MQPQDHSGFGCRLMKSTASAGCVVAAMLGLVCHFTGASEPTPEQVQFFEREVRPLLAAECYQCHGEKKQKANLRVDSRAGLLAGGESGPVLAPGQPEQSRIVDAVRYQNPDLQMPPKGKLSEKQIAVLVEWVKLGAPWPNGEAVPVKPLRDAFAITDADRKFWSFRPVRRPTPPGVTDSSHVASPIDAFIRARLEAQGLRPGGPADSRELIRRVYFDLIGLPPTPEEVAAFAADRSPAAYEQLIDRLLESPRYGERWSRHWLDLVRYAQTNGYERDGEKPNAWRYRDYVIRAFNADKPYDRFVKEQLAGDELADATFDSIIATGYYRLGVWDDEPDDKHAALYEELDDVVRTTGDTFLGLTIGCARCHDHKFDPVAQDDYYQMLAFFRNVAPYGHGDSPTHWSPAADAIFTPLAEPAQVAAWQARQADIQAQVGKIEGALAAIRNAVGEKLFQSRVAALEEPLRQALATAAEQRTPEQQQLASEAMKQATPNEKDVENALDPAARAETQKMAGESKKLLESLRQPPFEMALSVREPAAAPQKTYVFVRGNPSLKGKEVEPRFLTVLGGAAPALHRAANEPESGYRTALRQLGVQNTSGRRLAFAEWLVRNDNPLTPRVIVNRIWQHHFGRGLVATPSDFGHTGSPPSHPDLLDWLTAEFIDGGWRMKRMHKLILLSHTWRQSSRGQDPAAAALDPGNLLLWRQNLRRLEAEAIRDTVLSVSGQLNLAMEGQGVFPELPPEVLATQSRPGSGWGTSNAAEQSRRSVYLFIKRTLGIPLMESFDLPSPDKPEPVRATTTVAPQALILLNSQFIDRSATACAERLIREAGGDAARQIHRGWQLAFGREPTAGELETSLDYIARQERSWRKLHPAENDQAGENSLPRRAAVAAWCRLVFNLNEFVYVD